MPRLIEIDGMTGNERDITWTVNGNNEEPSLEDVQRSKDWREANIVGRYTYRIGDWSEHVEVF